MRNILKTVQYCLFYSAPVLCYTAPDSKDLLRGEYENKIRIYSAPEKIFECFASVNEKSSLLMTHSDLFKALTPFNYQNQTELPEFHSKGLIEFADSDKNGTITFQEYYIVTGFLKSNFPFKS